MVLTCIITELSFRYVEMPIRRRQLGVWWDRLRDVDDPKRRQFIAVGAVGCLALFGFAAVSMATAPLRQNEVQAALDEAEGDITDVGALLESTTMPASTVAPSTTAVAALPNAADDPATAATTTVAPTTSAPSAIGRYLAIGDSVMAGAASPLKAAGFTVDAEESRQFGDYLAQLQALVDSGQLPEVVVVHLGTNGNIDESDAHEFFELLADVPRVIVLTNWVDRSWTESEQRADPVAPRASSRTSTSGTGRTWLRSARATATPPPTASTSAPTAPTTTRR